MSDGSALFGRYIGQLFFGYVFLLVLRHSCLYLFFFSFFPPTIVSLGLFCAFISILPPDDSFQLDHDDATSLSLPFLQLDIPLLALH